MTVHLLFRLLTVAVLFSGMGGTSWAGPETWTPVNGVLPAGGFEVDTTSRIEALAFYNTVYLASEGAESRIGWSGAYAGNCTPGTTNAAFREDVRRRVNYFRAICGLDSVTFDASPAANATQAGTPQIPAGTAKRTCAQASAYLNAFSNVFYDNFGLTHNPTAANSICYSSTAWNGSWHSNLTIGYFGPRAIDVYMADDNLGDDQSNNINVGHRRWILYSRAGDMSSGDVPPGVYFDGAGTYPVLPANALYVTGSLLPAATAPKQFVTWPAQGYFPAPLKPLRWSISFPGATFPTTAGSISVTGPEGIAVPITVLSSNQGNMADNTLVFQPASPPLPASADATYTVTVNGISGSGVPTSHSWQTTFFDPFTLGLNQNLTGPVQPPAAGADYQFEAAPLAGAYQVVSSTPDPPATWLENGDSAAPAVTADKTGTYPLLQGAGSLNGLGFGPFSGTKSFHLCFPLDSSEVDFLPHAQSFSLDGEFIPDSTSTLQFREYFRWLFTHNRLSAELSTDGGNKWTEVYGRNGSYVYSSGASYTSSGWDGTWHLRTISLAPWAGQPVRVRFILRPGAISFDGPDLNHGCYLDDISLTNVSRLTSALPVNLGQTSFRLDSQLTGSSLVPGTPYLLRVRPRIGSRFMGYSGFLTVVPRSATGFETAWPSVASQPQDDADGDGIPNLMEYAFGLNPSVPTASGSLPSPVLGSQGLSLDFMIPAGITDLSYTAECTTDFVNWIPVANQGTGSQRLFTVPVVSGQNCFLRLRVTQQLP